MSRLAGFLCLVLIAAAFAACGDDDSADSQPVAAEDLPAGTVAAVGEETIAKEELNAQVAALRRAQSGGSSKASRKQLEQQALATLLQREWLEQEAEQRGVKVDDAAVRRRWRSVSREQFPTRRALRRFLGGRREADVIAQLRLQALSEAIEQDVRRDAGDDADAAVRRYRKDFQRSWQDSTSCRKGYAAPGCVGS